MNRRELIQALAERLDTDRRSAESALGAVTDLITATVARGEAVAISGFAKFARVERAARMGRNPQNGQPIRIKASRKARITPLKAFKDAVLSGKAPAAAKKATTAKKTTAKKATAKKTTARKAAPARKTTARKAPAKAPARKTAAKKTAAKKSTAKKATAKKTTRR